MLVRSLLCLVLALCLGLSSPAAAETANRDRRALTEDLQKIVDDYLGTNASVEGVTAISASVSLAAGEPNINVVAGRTSREADAAPIKPDTLFPIGSVTKSMTSAVVLQLVREGVLSLDAPIGPWLQKNWAWKDATLRRLLNMTSGIPGYDQTDAFMASVARGGIGRHFTGPVLISFTDPDLPGAPEPTTGFDYSNVNYILAQMIVERATGKSLDDHIRERLLTGGHGLDATFYSSGPYPIQCSAGPYPATWRSLLRRCSHRLSASTSSSRTPRGHKARVPRSPHPRT